MSAKSPEFGGGSYDGSTAEAWSMIDKTLSGSEQQPENETQGAKQPVDQLKDFLQAGGVDVRALLENVSAFVNQPEETVEPRERGDWQEEATNVWTEMGVVPDSNRLEKVARSFFEETFPDMNEADREERIRLATLAETGRLGYERKGHLEEWGEIGSTHDENGMRHAERIFLPRRLREMFVDKGNRLGDLARSEAGISEDEAIAWELLSEPKRPDESDLILVFNQHPRHKGEKREDYVERLHNYSRGETYEKQAALDKKWEEEEAKRQAKEDARVLKHRDRSGFWKLGWNEEAEVVEKPQPKPEVPPTLEESLQEMEKLERENATYEEWREARRAERVRKTAEKVSVRQGFRNFVGKVTGKVAKIWATLRPIEEDRKEREARAENQEVLERIELPEEEPKAKSPQEKAQAFFDQHSVDLEREKEEAKAQMRQRQDEFLREGLHANETTEEQTGNLQDAMTRTSEDMQGDGEEERTAQRNFARDLAMTEALGNGWQNEYTAQEALAEVQRLREENTKEAIKSMDAAMRDLYAENDRRYYTAEVYLRSLLAEQENSEGEV